MPVKYEVAYCPTERDYSYSIIAIYEFENGDWEAQVENMFATRGEADAALTAYLS